MNLRSIHFSYALFSGVLVDLEVWVVPFPGFYSILSSAKNLTHATAVYTIQNLDQKLCPLIQFNCCNQRSYQATSKVVPNGYECRNASSSRSPCRLIGRCMVIGDALQFTCTVDIPSRHRLRSSVAQSPTACSFLLSDFLLSVTAKIRVGH